jgi:hypothetical protein
MASKNSQAHAEGRLRSVYTQVTDGRAPAQENDVQLKRSDRAGRMQVARRAFLTDHREIYQSENGDRCRFVATTMGASLSCTK